jgi:hypothetical protein
MAGTTSDRSEEFKRLGPPGSHNNYYGGNSGDKSAMKPGFGPKKRSAKDPNNTGAGTSKPNGR